MFMNVNAGTKFQVNYYNQRTLAYEPLVEPWAIMVKMEQENPYTEKVMVVRSQQMLNINMTYGMALTLRKIVDKLD